MIVRKKDKIQIPAACIVQEKLSGKVLSEYIKPYSYISEDICRYIFKELVKGLSYLHQIGLAHGDLKPEKVLIDDAFNVKIFGYGLCPCQDETPDQAQSETSSSSSKFFCNDLFALGSILFMMKFGQQRIRNLAQLDQQVFWQKQK